MCTWKGKRLVLKKSYRVASLLIPALLATLGSTAASALTVGSTLGLDAGYACLETATSCFAERDFDLAGVYPATGTVDINGGPQFYSIDISLGVASATYSGGFDGVDSITFSNLTFDITGWQGVDILQTGTVATSPALGLVTGSYQQYNGAAPVGSSVGINEQVTFSNFICSTDGTGQCGFEVGFVNSPPGFPSLIEPIGATGGGTDHQFVMTFNVVVPEPSTASLLGLGLVGVAALRRRRA